MIERLCLLLLAQFFNGRLDRLCPDLVALAMGVKKIRHDLLGQDAVVGEKLIADVQIEHTLVVGKLADQGVDFFVELAS